MHHTLSGENCENGTALFAVIGITIITLGFVAALFTLTQSSTSALGETQRNTACDYLTQAALSAAFAEIASQDDTTGYGLGAMGLGKPIVYRDSQGNPVGEYKTIVKLVEDQNVILAVAGVPNLTNPEALRAAEAVVNTDPSFLLRPKPGAVTVSGPVNKPYFPSMGSNDLLIDGGLYPAFTLSNQKTFEGFMSKFGDLLYSSVLDGSELKGGVTSTYDHPKAGDITLPVSNQDSTGLTSETLNDYRNSLRTSVIKMAASANRTIISSVSGNQTWGTPGKPEVTVIDAQKIGKDKVFATNNQTITGNGTLIINHTCLPGKNGANVNLNWTGNIFVLGYDGDGSDLFYTYGTQGTINGNLILLASDKTEASLEMTNSKTRPSNLTINGGLLTLAEAKSHESEIELESSSKLTVNGLVGMYGSRMELQANKGTELNINGTVSMGMAEEIVTSLSVTNDFEFLMAGKVKVIYDKEKVDKAVENLAGMQADTLGGDSKLASFDLRFAGGYSGSKSGTSALQEIDTLLQANGSDGDNGYKTP